MGNSNINVRIDSEVKSEAQALFTNLGMDMSTAINIFLRQSIAYGGIPFTIQQRYNAETEAAMNEAKQIAAGKIATKKYSSAEELFAELDAEDD